MSAGSSPHAATRIARRRATSTSATVTQGTAPSRPALWRRIRPLVVASAWIACTILVSGVVANIVSRGWLGADAHAYWLTGHESDWYSRPPQSRDAYLYSPLFAQAIWPLTHLPWHWFRAVWMIAEAGAFAWLLRPLGWAWGVPAFALCLLEVSQGNIWGFVGVVAVIGLQRPGYWALPLLTKPTLGVGLCWFIVRRDWRAVLGAFGTTGLLVIVSFAASRGVWLQWIRFLLSNGTGDPVLALRLAGAIVTTILAAKLRRRWLLVVSLLLAAPVVHGLGVLSLLAALPRLMISAAQSPTRSPGSGWPTRGRRSAAPPSRPGHASTGLSPATQPGARPRLGYLTRRPSPGWSSS